MHLVLLKFGHEVIPGSDNGELCTCVPTVEYERSKIIRINKALIIIVYSIIITVKETYINNNGGA